MRVASGCLCFSFIFLLLKKNKFSILIFGIFVMINSSVCVLLCFLCFVVLCFVVFLLSGLVFSALECFRSVANVSNQK